MQEEEEGEKGETEGEIVRVRVRLRRAQSREACISYATRGTSTATCGFRLDPSEAATAANCWATTAAVKRSTGFALQPLNQGSNVWFRKFSPGNPR